MEISHLDHFVLTVKAIIGTWHCEASADSKNKGMDYDGRTTYVNKVTIKSLNDFSGAFEKMFEKSLLEKEKIKSTIVSIDNQKLTLKDESGSVSSCDKIIL